MYIMGPHFIYCEMQELFQICD